METQSSQTSRRDFLRASAAAGASMWLVGSSAASIRRSYAANEKLNVGVIGCGGMGWSDLNGMSSQNIIAFCDVDEVKAAAAFKKYPKVPHYHDFRVMLDREKNLDTVTVSTPDHVHAVAAAAAMHLGHNVYVQKPMTHNIAEARALTELARKMGVATSMGNQGTAMDGLRRVVDLYRAGAIGKVREVHSWTNRPIWPQGIGRPEKIQAIPETMRWDLWLGPAPHRPYNKAYAPFNWRGFWDFGTGALGDMACHIINAAYMALELGSPRCVEAESSEVNDETAPSWSIIRYQFPARGEQPPVTFTWYDGKKKPPASILPGQKLSTNGTMMVGEKGKLYVMDSYGVKFKLLPEELAAEYKDMEPILPRSPGLYKEWIAACKGGPKSLANFDYAGPLTETVLLGNLAVRSGKKIEWDAANLRVPNCPEAEQYLSREYRWGYSL